MTSSEGHKNQSPPVRRPVLLGLFAGTCIGLGYLLSGVPNVELMSLVAVLSGVVLGSRYGLVCGSIAATVYSLGSPYGVPMPLILGAQVVGLGVAGAVGGPSGRTIRRLQRAGRIRAALVAAALTGLVVTLVFDLLTNLAIVGAFDLEPMVVLVGAVPFFLIHGGVNTVVFALLLPELVHRMSGLARAPLAGRGAGVATLTVMAALAVAGPAVAADTALGELPGSRMHDHTASPVDTHDVDRWENIGPSLGRQWSRPLWNPFARQNLEWLKWRTPWLPVLDGGLGGPAVILGEAQTSPVPLYVRDGIPLGTGHALADDPWLVPLQGVGSGGHTWSADGFGGTGGRIDLVTNDREPDKAVSVYRGVKGPHESYMRGFSILTPAAAWRVGFEFDESIDNEAYNFTDLPDEVFRPSPTYFTGHGKIRQTRARLIRNLDTDNSLAVAYTYGRKTKDALPAWGAEHQEIWDNGISATMRGRSGQWDYRGSLHWTSRDLEWGSRPSGSTQADDLRKLETGRNGLVVDFLRRPAREAVLPAHLDSLVVPVDTVATAAADTALAAADSLPVADLSPDAAPAATDTLTRGTAPDTDLSALGTDAATGLQFRMVLNHWNLEDSGASWSPDHLESFSGEGETAQITGRNDLALGPARLSMGLEALWDSHGGLGPGAAVTLAQNSTRPRWELGFSRSGRAPRSDELFTPVRRDVNGRELEILPNRDLKREKTWRVGLYLGAKVLGFDLAVDSSVRHLSDGITWRQDAEAIERGAWANDLELLSTRITGSIGRQGRFLGWGRLKLEGTWQGFDERKARAALLPPEQHLRLQLGWENHFFREDGVVQLMLYSTLRGEMADPWDVTRAEVLEAITVHDLLVGFRLVGAHLSLAFRNLTGERVRLTAGTWSHDMEIDLRLHWVFLY